MGQTDNRALGIISPEARERIRACHHEHTNGVGHGYAHCQDCGALLPDEDPDLLAKCP
jgi:hypothetical protein